MRLTDKCEFEKLNLRKTNSIRTMKTKSLIITALLTAASSVGLMAQSTNVYSQNVVGYINLTLNPGFNLLGNQLNAGAGNTLNNVFTNVPDGSLIYTMNPNGTFIVDVYNAQVALAPIGWYDNTTGDPSTTVLNPGRGIFFNNPQATNVTITEIGSVAVGTNSVAMNPSGFTLISSATPEIYQLTGTNFPAVDQMLYYSLNPNGSFTIDVYNTNTSLAPVGWYDNSTGDPVAVQPAVGQGFFINNPLNTPITWTRSYTIN